MNTEFKTICVVGQGYIWLLTTIILTRPADYLLFIWLMGQSNLVTVLTQKILTHNE